MNTTDFTVSFPEWRIRWEYTPSSEYPENAGLTVMVYSRKEPGAPVDQIFALGTADKVGTSNIHNKTGIFYLTVSTSPDIVSYTIIVEKDIDSISEFPALTFMLSVFAAASLITVSIVHRTRNERKRLQFVSKVLCQYE